MTVSKEKLELIVKIIADRLGNRTYAIRGTASLVLQGLDMGVDDIDILCNAESALACNLLFAEYLVEKVEYKESPRFKSYFGKFLIDGVKVEIMGDWQIFSDKKGWSEIFNAGVEQTDRIIINGLSIPVTKIEIELKTFALMGRWSALNKIKRLTKHAYNINL